MNQFTQEPQNGQENAVHNPAKGLVLPIDAEKGNILEAITKNQSTVLVGETGSGKTTKTPLFLLEQFPDAKIAITSPRVLPARSVSKYVASQLGERVGDTVGVITRDKRETGPKTRSFFMTDGVLLNMLRKDPALSELDIVMVDEAHERGLNIDLSLGLLKRAQKLRQEKGLAELKIVVASATLEEEKFTNYFSDTPLVKVPGRMFPVEVSYHPFKETGELDSSGRRRDYTNHAADVAGSILLDTEKDGDILIFMPGEAEIMRTLEHLRKTCSEDVELLPLFGNMNPQDQDRIFTKNGKRKIIVSTNIAETSVTIDTVRHVIDTGYKKEKRYNPVTGIDVLDLYDASQANMDQRKGRAGRVSSGWCYRLIEEELFSKREAFTQPEILRSNLAETVLKMKDMGIDDIEGFEFIDQPESAAVVDAIRQLTLLGALDENEIITELGKEMAELPLDPGLARAVLEAKKLGCLPLMIDVAAMFSTTKQLFFKAKDSDPERIEKESRQSSLKIDGSDYLTALNVWRKWNEDNCSTQFAVDHLVNVKALREAGQVRDLLLRTLGASGIPGGGDGEQADEKEKITQCLLVSKPDNIFYNDRNAFSKWPVWSPASPNVAGRKGISIFPGSSCFKAISEQDFFVGEDIYTNDKGVTYARRCHSVALESLKKIAPHLVTEKEEQDTFGYTHTITKINGVEIARHTVYNRPTEARYDPYAQHFSSDPYQDRSLERVVDAYSIGQLKVGEETLYGHNTRVATILGQYSIKNHTIPDCEWDDRIKEDIKNGVIKTLEDAEARLDSYVLNLEDLVTKEQQEETIRLSPDSVNIGDVSVPIKYKSQYSSYGSPSKKVATLTFNLDMMTKIMKDKKGSIDVSLPLVDDIVFEYTYMAPYHFSDSDTLYEQKKTFPSIKDMMQFALTNKFEANEREKITVQEGGMSKEQKAALFSSLPKDDLFDLQGALDTKDKKEKLSTRLAILRTLIGIVHDYVTQAPDSKTKNKVLAQIVSLRKELRGTFDEVEAYKGKPLKVEKVLNCIISCESFLSGNDILSLVGVTDKRYLGAVYLNTKTLEQAAHDGDVEMSEDVAKKILKKSFDLLIGNNPTQLDESSASEILIDEIL